ncbi:MAG TPA: hypothetical protein VJ521_13780 [Acidobacteriota bacterium]|nr:hypothetical protein [Acidobacteriota bacterium]
MKDQKYISAFVLIVNFLIAAPTIAQQLKPVAPFHLVDHGYGAAALGIGGAFVGVADDVSTIYWNPAGLTQLPEVQSYLDFRFQ